MLNLFQHLKIRDPEPILKQVQHKVQGDMYSKIEKKVDFRKSSCYI
jgi:hypothetical protein